MMQGDKRESDGCPAGSAHIDHGVRIRERPIDLRKLGPDSHPCVVVDPSRDRIDGGPMENLAHKGLAEAGIPAAKSFQRGQLR
jgi:hypothetical protein